MRIGIDMIGGQDPDGQVRGIGRYTAQFVDALTRLDSQNTYLLYAHDRLPVRCPGHARGWELRRVPSGHGPLAQATQRLVDRNPDRLDLYLVTSPFSRVEGYRPPAKPAGPLQFACILYDLIPMIVGLDLGPGSQSGYRVEYFECVARLKHYDLLLAISEATRADALRHLGVPRRRVANISSASRAGPFALARTPDLPASAAALSIRKPYVLSVVSADPHKNADGLLRAFARLPQVVRASHQLVLVGNLGADYDLDLAAQAHRLGIADRLVLTGQITDEQLGAAYQHCAVFASLSHYEGFGLPILEAMRCGAPVVAGNNSSQVEVAGDAGLLARTDDDADMADKLCRVLTDRDLAASLRQRGLARADAFSWDKTVERARQAFRALPRVRHPKPLIALFCPTTPANAPVADYIQTLLRALCRSYTVHVYQGADELPYAPFADPQIALFDHRLFERHDRVWGYHAVLYQLAGDQRAICRMLARRPGIVTVHEPARGQARRIAASALRVIVHDARAAERLRHELPAHAERIHWIPCASKARSGTLEGERATEMIGEEYGVVIEKAAALDSPAAA